MRLPLSFATKAARRATSWSVFGVAGLALTATWATGVAGNESAALTPTGTASITASAPAAGASRFATLITAAAPASPLEIGFKGKWGTLVADQLTFQANLSSVADSDKYFVEISLGNPFPVGFTALNVEFVYVSKATACTDADIATASTSSVLAADNADATAVFTGINNTTNDYHCFGVKKMSTTNNADQLANDSAKSFIRRASADNAPSTMPKFVAILNQAS